MARTPNQARIYLVTIGEKKSLVRAVSDKAAISYALGGSASAKIATADEIAELYSNGFTGKLADASAPATTTNVS